MVEEQRRREGDEARNLQAAQGIARMSLGTSLLPPAAPSPAAPSASTSPTRGDVAVERALAAVVSR